METNDILFQCLLGGIGQYISTVSKLASQVNDYSPKFVFSLKNLGSFLLALQRYSHSNMYTYWIEADFVKFRHASLFISSYDRLLMVSDIPKLIDLLKFSFQNILLDNTTCLLDNLTTILYAVSSSCGLVSEFGFINRGIDKSHFKLLCSFNANTKTQFIDSHLKFYNQLRKMLKEQCNAKIIILSQELIFCFLHTLKPKSIFVSISVYPKEIILDLEFYPPLDSIYIDKGTGVSTAYKKFWHKAIALSGYSPQPKTTYSTFDVFSCNRIAIEDKLHHLKLSANGVDGTWSSKLYRLLRVVSYYLIVLLCNTISTSKFIVVLSVGPLFLV
jgi:hypothetical protein